jgi:hypothetical protein
MRQGCLAGHYSIHHSPLCAAAIRAAISQSVFVEFDVQIIEQRPSYRAGFVWDFTFGF